FTTIPMAILIVLMLIMGTHIPQPVTRLLENAATIVMNPSSTQTPTFNWPWVAAQHVPSAQCASTSCMEK
ncbi:MAG: hypothetical protein L0I83_06205, partial [Enterobacterales bacterium]|nr:hypothetical protein [Enterobacterales bacterium]